ncbi:hypothetical protein [Streptomyces sp. NPDC005374]|uniref:hypothetical protein n=1 Tax=Streptomyces sp. NPDC005374 TaxID=3364713 RepID=UPI00367BE2D9
MVHEEADPSVYEQIDAAYRAEYGRHTGIVEHVLCPTGPRRHAPAPPVLNSARHDRR